MSIHRRDLLKQVVAGGVALGLGDIAAVRAEEVVEGGSFRINFFKDFEGFDHTKAPSPEQARVQILFAIHDLLFDYDPITREITPRLAIKAEHNDAFDRWTVTLREGVKFSNGEELTAKAYERHFTRLLASPLANTFRNHMSLPLSAVRAPSPREIVFEFSEPAFAFDIMMGTPVYTWYLNALSVQEQRDNDPDYNRVSVAAGPYMIKEWVPGKGFVLVRNPHFWNPKEVHADEIVFRLVSGATEWDAPWASLRAGDCDVMYTQGELISWGREQRDFNFVEAVRSFVAQMLSFDVNKEPLNDVRVRRALVHALDRRIVAQVSTQGGLPPAAQTFHDKEVWHCSDVTPLDFNPDKARALLKEYGKPLPRIAIMTLVGQANTASQIIQSMWRDVGVQSDITVVPGAGILFKALAQGETMASVSIGGPTIHPTLFQMNLASTSPFNTWHVRSPKIDAAIAKIKAARSNDAIRPAHCELEQAKADEAPLAFLTYGRIGIFSKKNIGGIRPPAAPWFKLHQIYRVKT